MTAQQYLGQIEKLTFMIEAKNDEIIKLRTLACKVTASTDGIRVKSSPDPDKLANAVAKIIDLSEEMAELINSLYEKKAEIITKIDNIEEPMCHKFLTCRYVKNLSGKEICSEMGVSPASLYRIQNASIKEFERVYGTDFKKISFSKKEKESN